MLVGRSGLGAELHYLLFSITISISKAIFHIFNVVGIETRDRMQRKNRRQFMIAPDNLMFSGTLCMLCSRVNQITEYISDFLIYYHHFVIKNIVWAIHTIHLNNGVKGWIQIYRFKLQTESIKEYCMGHTHYTLK